MRLVLPKDPIVKIINKGRGVHSREIAGIKKLQEELPPEWMAFTNLELALPHGGREIDVILICEDRIIAIDIKDWNGKIESSGGAWSLNGRPRDGGSPVAKILTNARELWILLDKYLKQQAVRAGGAPNSADVPKVEGCVVLTATSDRSGISPTEINKVFSIDHFIKMIKNSKSRVAELGGVSPIFHSPGITTPTWKEKWNRFFNVGTGPFRVSTRQYGGYRAESDAHSFQHAKEIFCEFDVVDPSASGATGLLRRWDFTKAEARFQNEEARLEIAGRERKVIAWLNDRNPDCETAILQPKVDDPEKGVEYWEVFDRRRRLQRLSDLSAEQISALPRDVRIELLRQAVTRMKVLHDINAAHLDLGSHSVWIESPSITRISHLLAASFPEVSSLGKNRYQFLSSSTLPEDVFDTADTNQRKDVFLLGCIAHTLFFGTPPNASQVGDPPEWNTLADAKGEFSELHDWLAQALDWAPDCRFADAGEMLTALNSALDTRPSAKDILEGLERFRTISSQRKLFSEYPVVTDLRDDSRIGMWTSEVNGRAVLVKLWKRESWGDQGREAPRLLAFLEQAETLRLDRPPGCVDIERVVWTGDALVLVQQYVDAPNLAQINELSESTWRDRDSTLTFIQTLAQTITTLHERRVAHGDIKPDNILVVHKDLRPHPILIDLVDFVPTDDGEQISTAYAPKSGGRFERDCFAVTKIAEELFAQFASDELGIEIRDAIVKVRSGPPENATLLPLIEAIELKLRPAPLLKVHKLNLVIPGADESKFISDEGKIGLRLVAYGRKLCLCGATEQIVVNLNADGNFSQARRQKIDQKQLTREAKFEFATVNAVVTIEEGLCFDLEAITDLLTDKEIEPTWLDARKTIEITQDTVKEEENREPSQDNDEVDDTEVTLEAALDQLAETVALQPPSSTEVNVPKLWERLLDLEAELTIEGCAIGQSSYQKTAQRHMVPFELESGAFDFARDDTVNVSRLDRTGRWTRIGNLDLSASSPSHLVIDTRKGEPKTNSALVFDSQRLRFESHFEVTSRSRRRAATLRVLSRDSRVAELVDVFHPSKELLPHTQDTPVDAPVLSERYGLNAVQIAAFQSIVNQRPVGLLQGPPGTGKTRFIAALVHFALTHGLARNVLLASQSHEAVNGATEEVIKLFRRDDDMPSVLRVGHEGNVSEQLLPYHVARVEGLIKDRFRAEQSSRLHVVGRALAMPSTLVDQLIALETIVRPIVDKILQLKQQITTEEGSARLSALEETLEIVTKEKVGLAYPGEYVVDESFLDWLAKKIASQNRFTNIAKIEHFRNVTELARDFMGSVSSRDRTFETFLAGTRRIVAGTCVGLGRSSLGLTSTPFDLVIVDEAARCTAGELAVPLQSGRWIVLVGDQRQLEPQHRSEVVRSVAKELQISEREILRSDFERVFDSKYGDVAGSSLSEQYRMLPPIGAIVSSAFYKSKLTHGRTKPIIEALALPFPLQKPLSWITTDGFGETAYQKDDKQRKGALYNITEADMIVSLILKWDTDEALCGWIASQKEFSQTIGVICTYRSQSQLIQQKLKRVHLSEVMRATIKVDTVDSYQGKQNPIVILSLVRNNADGRAEDAVKTIRDGFMAQPNRLNVAISRAMDRLVIVGAATRWRSGSPMDDILRGFSQQDEEGTAVFVDGPQLKEQLEVELNNSRKSKHVTTATDGSIQ
jgi:serine/threonine protein kinase